MRGLRQRISLSGSDDLRAARLALDDAARANDANAQRLSQELAHALTSIHTLNRRCLFERGLYPAYALLEKRSRERVFPKAHRGNDFARRCAILVGV